MNPAPLTSACRRTQQSWAADLSVMSFRPIQAVCIAVLFWLSNTTASELPTYEGRWKYDIEKSTASIMSTEEVPQNIKDYVGEEGSFWPGSLSLLFTTDSFGTGHISKAPSDIKFYKIEMIAHNANHFRFRLVGPGEFQNNQLTLFFENDCIYYFESKWKFKSYFCKWDENS